MMLCDDHHATGNLQIVYTAKPSDLELVFLLGGRKYSNSTCVCCIYLASSLLVLGFVNNVVNYIHSLYSINRPSVIVMFQLPCS